MVIGLGIGTSLLHASENKMRANRGSSPTVDLQVIGLEIGTTLLHASENKMRANIWGQQIKDKKLE